MSTAPPPRQLIRLRIEGMTCGSCVARVERALRAVPGVTQASVNLTTETATIEASDAAPSRASLADAVRQAGYDADTFREGDPTRSGLEQTNAARMREQRQALVQAIGIGLPIIALHWLAPTLRSSETGGQVWPTAIQALLCAVLLSSSAGAPILVGGLRALVHRAPNMDLLITLGVVAAFAAGVVTLVTGASHASHFHTAAMILMVINVGRLIELRARRDASSAVSTLARRMPRTAQLVSTDGITSVPIGRVVVGDRIRVPPDTIVPVDGRIIDGEGTLDESAVTGESVPRFRKIDDDVAAGTLLVEGVLTIEATRVGSDSAIGRVIQMVEQAQTGKTRMQRIADRVAGVFVPIVIACALAALLGAHFVQTVDWSTAVMRAVAVLVIACPCAMGLATPTAVLVATGSAALGGILVRDASALEAAGRIDCMMLDKTGTLTSGRPAVSDVLVSDVASSEYDEAKIIELAASAEQYSQHPLAQAIVAEALRRQLPLCEPANFESHPGRGLSAEQAGRRVVVGSAAYLRENAIDLDRVGDCLHGLGTSRLSRSAVFVAVDQVCVGVIHLTDQIRPEASAAIASVAALGITTEMVTGDHAGTANHVAAILSIRQVTAEATPETKLELVRQRRRAGRVVAFVGDGINDAPALTEADVGITFASATDVATSAADITIVHNDLCRLAVIVSLGRRSVRIIKQNLFWAFLYNVIAIPLAAVGKIPPGYAAAAMMASSINSLRLREKRRNEKRLEGYKVGRLEG